MNNGSLSPILSPQELTKNSGFESRLQGRFAGTAQVLESPAGQILPDTALSTDLALCRNRPRIRLLIRIIGCYSRSPEPLQQRRADSTVRDTNPQLVRANSERTR